MTPRSLLPPSRRVKNLTIEQSAVYLVRGWSPFCATILPACAASRRGRGWMWWWTRSKNEAPRLHDANRYGDIYAVMQTPPMRHSGALYDVPWDRIFPRELVAEGGSWRNIFPTSRKATSWARRVAMSFSLIGKPRCIFDCIKSSISRLITQTSVISNRQD